jgi:hypothetical protein
MTKANPGVAGETRKGTQGRARRERERARAREREREREQERARERERERERKGERNGAQGYLKEPRVA